MINWFRKLHYIIQNFDALAAEVKSNQRCCHWLKNEMDEGSNYVHQRIDLLEREVKEAVKIIKDRTDMHLDVSPRMKGDPHQIILIGKYRNRDYIQTFAVPPEDFRGLVERCVEMQKYARRGRIDALPEMRTIINEESMKWWDED